MHWSGFVLRKLTHTFFHEFTWCISLLEITLLKLIFMDNKKHKLLCKLTFFLQFLQIKMRKALYDVDELFRACF